MVRVGFGLVHDQGHGWGWGHVMTRVRVEVGVGLRVRIGVTPPPRHLQMLQLPPRVLQLPPLVLHLRLPPALLLRDGQTDRRGQDRGTLLLLAWRPPSH